MKRIVVVAAALALAAATLSGQANNRLAELNKKIVGKWFTGDRKNYIEFGADGNCSTGRLQPNAAWRVENDKLSMWAKGQDFRCGSGTLTLKGPDTIVRDSGMGGDVEIFRRERKGTPAPKPAPNLPSLSYLSQHLGDYSYPFLERQPLASRLRTLLGAEYPRFRQNMEVSSPLEADNGILFTAGNAPHQGAVESALLLIDDRANLVEVMILHRGNAVRIWTEGRRAIQLPAAVSNILRNWPQNAVSEAINRLRSEGIQ